MRKIYLLSCVLLLTFMQGTAQCTTPTITVSGTDEICSGNSVTLTATTTADDIRWYNAATGGTQLGTGETFTTPVLNTTTSFWAEAREPGTGAGSPTSGGAKTAPTSTGGSTVNTASDPWGLSFNATQEFVLNSVDVFLTTATPGTIVILFTDSAYNTIQTFNVAAPAGGTNSNPVQFTVPLNITVPIGNQYRLLVQSGPAMIRDLGTNAFPYPIGAVGTVTGGTINGNPASNAGVYYFLYNWNYTPGSAPCISAREEFEVTVIPTPAAPATQEFSICGSGTIADLNTDADIVWYAEIDDVNPLAETTTLTEGTFYISRIVNGCESSRTAVEVNINAIPLAPAENSYTICGSGTVGEMIPEGEIRLWYASADADEPLEESVTLMTTTYYVSHIANGCESNRTVTTVTINEIPDAPELTSYSICGTQTVGQASEGNSYVWYTQEQDGEALESTITLANGTYYVSQTANGCESSRAIVTVTINPIPDVPNAEAGQGFTPGQTIADLTVDGENLNWYNDEDGENAIPDSTVLVDGATYYVSQTINGCESALSAITVNEVLGTGKLNFNDFTCHPNPTDGLLTIINSTVMENVAVYTLIGQKVYSSTINTPQYELNLTALPPGTYIVMVQSGTAIKNIKIVKQ